MCGAILSFVTFLSVTFFAYLKLQDLLGYKDYKVMEQTNYEFFDSNDSFGHENGLAFTAGLIEWDDGEKILEDQTYGQLRFYVKSWGPGKPYDETFHEIGSHVCLESETNDIENSNSESSNFYQTSRNSDFDLRTHFKRMKCIDDPEKVLNLWGYYSSPAAANIVIAFDRCNNETSYFGQCKSDEQINKWMRGKYILFGYNNRRFVKDKFGVERIVEKVSTEWYPMNSSSRIDYPTQLTRTNITLNDSHMNYAGLATENEVGFFLDVYPSRVLPYLNNWQNAISIEMSLDLRVYHRQVYSWGDYVSDMGGLFGALSPICMSILSIINFYSSYQFLMDDLFITTIKDFGQWSRKPEQNYVQYRPCKSLRLTCVTLILPSCFKCCQRSNRREKLRAKGLRQVLHESSISNILRQLRLLNALAKQGKTEEQWDQLQEKHFFIDYNDLASSESSKEEVSDLTTETKIPPKIKIGAADYPISLNSNNSEEPGSPIVNQLPIWDLSDSNMNEIQRSQNKIGPQANVPMNPAIEKMNNRNRRNKNDLDQIIQLQSLPSYQISKDNRARHSTRKL